MSKIILQDSVMTAEILSAEGSRLDIVQNLFAAFFRSAEVLHTSMHQNSILFEVLQQSPPKLDSVEFGFEIRCDGRLWKQGLHYTPTEKLLSMNWNGTTGSWKESEIANIPSFRTLLLDLYRQMQIIKVTVTWLT